MMSKIPRKYIVAGCIGVLGILGVGLGMLRFRGEAAPDPKTSDSKQVSNYLASDSFGKLKNEQKIHYMEQLRQRPDFAGPPRGLNAAQEEKIRQNIGPVFRQRMEQEMEEFSKMTPEQQTAFLDKRIDQMEAFRKRGGSGNAVGKSAGPLASGPGGPPPGGRAGGRPGGPPSRDMMRHMLSNTSPKQRAIMTKVMDAMRKRMKERGIQDPGPPGPR
jgi:Spy/CpxP family protein refolding chaperone